MKMGSVICTLCVVLLASIPAQAGTVRMASLQSDLHQMALWVAQEKGFFAQEGVTVENVGTFRAGPEIMTAFASGSVDMAYCGEAPATIAFARGSKVRLAAQANAEGSGIVVASGSEIATVAQLKGKTVGIPGNGSVQDFLVRKAIKAAGLNPTDVEIKVVPVPEMSTALERGDIAAFVAWQPFIAQAVAKGKGKILATSTDIWPGHPCCCLLFTEKMAGTADMNAVVRAHIKATAFINEHPEEAAAIAAQVTGMPLEVIRAAMKTVVYTDKPATEAEKEYVRFLVTSGFIPANTDPNVLTNDFIPSSK